MNPRPKKKRVRLSKKDWSALRARKWRDQGGRCEMCGEPVRLDGDSIFNTAHLAHIKSKGAGGDDTYENTRILCYSCHFGPEAHGVRWTIKNT